MFGLIESQEMKKEQMKELWKEKAEAFFSAFKDIDVGSFSTEAELDSELKKRIIGLREDLLGSFPEFAPIFDEVNGVTALHTAKHSLSLGKLKEYQILSPKLQVLVRQISLLHDIGKYPRKFHKEPGREYKRDPAHPFVSAKIAANLFARFYPANQTLLDQWGRKIDEFTESVDSGVVNGSSSELEEFYNEALSGLSGIFSDSNVTEILRVIFIHQGPPAVNKYPPALPMSAENLRRFVSKDTKKLLLPMMFADTTSWRLYNEKERNEFLSDTRGNAETY